MKCEDLRERLSALLEEELPAEEREEAERHLVSCEACRADAAGVRGVMELLHGLPRERAPRDLPAQVTARLDEPARPALPWRWVPVAAAACLALAAGLILGMKLPHGSELTLPAQARVSLDAKGYAVAEAPDGTRYIVLPAPEEGETEEALPQSLPASAPVYLGGDEETEFFLEPPPHAPAGGAHVVPASL